MSKEGHQFEAMNRWIDSKVSPFFNTIGTWQDTLSIHLYVTDLKIISAPVAVHGADDRLSRLEREKSIKRENHLIDSVVKKIETKLKFGSKKEIVALYDYDTRQYLLSIAQAILNQASKPKNDSLRSGLYLTLRSILLRSFEVSKEYEELSEQWRLLPIIAPMLVNNVNKDAVLEKLKNLLKNNES